MTPAPLALSSEGALRRCRTDLRWLTEVAVLRIDGRGIRLDPELDVERGIVVLSGTHDLAAGGGTWGSRGVRDTPYAGRPCAVFVPPRHAFAAQGGPGELLLFAARVTTAAALQPAKRPLLPLAGSNKVFDAQSGGWQRLEDLPDTPEALLPRRIEREEIGDCVVEAVFPVGFKARALSLFETVVPAGHSWRVPARAAHAVEELLYVRTDSSAAVRTDEREAAIQGEAVLPLAQRAQLIVRAGATPCYVALAAGGPKETT